MKDLIRWLFLFVIIFILSLSAKKVIDYNSPLSRNTRSLEKELASEISEENKDGSVKNLFDFDYDKAYVFGPYEPVEDMELKIGFKSSKLKQGVSEGTNNVLFVKGRKEVIYLFGGHYNEGYYIDLPIGEYNKEELDQMVYSVTKRELGNSSGPEKSYNYYNIIE